MDSIPGLSNTELIYQETVKNLYFINSELDSLKKTCDLSWTNAALTQIYNFGEIFSYLTGFAISIAIALKQTHQIHQKKQREAFDLFEKKYPKNSLKPTNKLDYLSKSFFLEKTIEAQKRKISISERYEEMQKLQPKIISSLYEGITSNLWIKQTIPSSSRIRLTAELINPVTIALFSIAIGLSFKFFCNILPPTEIFIKRNRYTNPHSIPNPFIIEKNSGSKIVYSKAYQIFYEITNQLIKITSNIYDISTCKEKYEWNFLKKTQKEEVKTIEKIISFKKDNSLLGGNFTIHVDELKELTKKIYEKFNIEQKKQNEINKRINKLYKKTNNILKEYDSNIFVFDIFSPTNEVEMMYGAITTEIDDYK